MDLGTDGTPVRAASDGTQALGRYGTPRWMRWSYTALAVMWTVLAVVSLARGRSWYQVVFAAIWVILAAVTWLVSAVVITAEGLRRGVRRIPWSDVAAVPSPSRWDQHAAIETRAGRKIVLQGVPGRLTPALRVLAQQGGAELVSPTHTESHLYR